MEIEWSEFKKIVDLKSLSIQFIEHSNNYHLRLVDGSFMLDCIIPLDPNNSDTLDFESNYKSKGNSKLEKRNEEGYAVLAPTFEDAQGLTTVWKGHLYVAQPNSLNIFDELIVTQLKLRGGWYKLLDNGTLGDYLEFSIIDKDNVLGYFDYFGLTVGQDVLELKKFVRTEYISPESKSRNDFASGGASEVMAGLYFRTYYYNSGNEVVNFSVTEKYHEA